MPVLARRYKIEVPHLLAVSPVLFLASHLNIFIGSLFIAQHIHTFVKLFTSVINSNNLNMII